VEKRWKEKRVCKIEEFLDNQKQQTIENLVDPASNICLDEGLSHANVRISRL
jgi:hypothetical protein